MILILSNKYDETTTFVIEWLDFLGKKWIRINDDDIVELEYLGDDIKFILVDNSFLLSDITSSWYRRGRFKIKWSYNIGDKNIEKFQLNEKLKLIQFVYYKLSTKPYLNKIETVNVNKLIVSETARKVGLNTPEDYLFSKKDFLEKILDSNKKYITKPISGDSILNYNEFSVFNYTKLLNTNEISIDNFFPSLVQSYIDKKYELRIFYMNRKFYSMAIFSQRSKNTNIDFRNYDEKKPSRTVPYELPKFIQVKINALMHKLDLNCGSIDIIVTPEDEFVFLEVNPVGQFGMVSYPCNYYLEREIANYLK